MPENFVSKAPGVARSRNFRDVADVYYGRANLSDSELSQMQKVYPAVVCTQNSFCLNLTPLGIVLQFIFLCGLAWLLAGCGNQVKSVAVATATVIVTTPVPPKSTATAIRTPTAEPTPIATSTQALTATPTLTAQAAATPTPIPLPEIDSEAQDFYYQGLTYAAAGLTEEALTSFDQAIALQPDYALAYLERGKLYLGQKQLGQAKSDFQLALEYTTDPVVNGEIKKLLQQVAAVPAVTSTPKAPQATPTPEVTVIIASGPPLEAQLGSSFTLPMGGTAHVAAADLTLVFQSILEDSRCPRQVECFWAGQVRIMIEVQQGGTGATSLELNTNPPSKQDTVSYAGYDIHLSQIDPYPEAPDELIPPEAYRATFVIKAK